MEKKNKIIAAIIIMALIIIVALIGFLLFLPKSTLPSNYLVKIDNFAFNMHDDGVAFYGDWIAWCERESAEIIGAKHNIYLYNTSTGTKTLINKEPARITGLALYDNKLVWSDNREGGEDPYSANISIYMYDIETKNETRLTSGDGAWMEMYEDNIVWVDNTYSPFGPYHIYLYKISSDEKQHVSSNIVEGSVITGTTNLPIPAIYENLIVWKRLDENNNDSIYSYDIETQQKRAIVSNLSGYDYLKRDIAIYKDNIAYGDGTSIYLYNFSDDSISFIMKHLKAESAHSDAHFSVIGIYENIILAAETSLDLVGSDMYERFTKYWTYNIETGEKTEIEAGLIISEGKILGFLNDYYYILFSKVEQPSTVALYLTDINDLF